MTREITAHHDSATMTPGFAAALAIHRAQPALSIVELCERAKLPGRTQRAVEHIRDCASCRVGSLCETGESLVRKIKPSANRTRSWLAMRSADVAQARKRREGAA